MGTSNREPQEYSRNILGISGPYTTMVLGFHAWDPDYTSFSVRDLTPGF